MAMTTFESQDEGLSPNNLGNNLRQLARSPHPYHRTGPKHSDLLSPPNGLHRSSQWPRTSSESGTEADDESTGVLKGLPAPPLRPRKGLKTGRSGNEDNDPWLSVLPSLVRPSSRSSRRSSGDEAGPGTREVRERTRQKRFVEVLRRLSETALLVSVGGVVLLRDDARALAWAWRKELLTHLMLVIALYSLYPFRILSSRNGVRISRLTSFVIPSSFDPAPLLYPIFLPIIIALSLPNHTPALILPNILLCLSSLPTPVVPLHGWIHGFSVSHWMATLLPIIASEHLSWESTLPKPLTLRGLDSEILVFVFPLQQALIPTLDFLLTTSLLPAELQLLSTALINLFLFAVSPQAEILKSLLWLGSMCIFISCRHVLSWEVALARIPSWKFRRTPSGSQSRKNLLYSIDHTVCQMLSRASSSESPASDSDAPGRNFALKASRTMPDPHEQGPSKEPSSAIDNVTTEEAFKQYSNAPRRRHTISNADDVALPERTRTTPGGRRKRLMAPGLASFLSMTVPQAQARKWLYALYVYVAAFVVAMGPVRKYVAEQALNGHEPFGWALGYLFGNVSWFRFWVIMWNLDHWISLPPLAMDDISDASCQLGWVEHLRQTTFGEANTRLLICLHCIAVLLTGLVVVFRLSSVLEVDTRRKVFHGIMVLMFFPTIYVDPAFCALALTIVLALFLLLDLFRASQLPPISRPLTHFLAPYVDGRDHRGPAIISHIFLLIGCSIPLWLSLADIPRTGASPWLGWNAFSRDVSMISGLVCVGMGDAAASLVGRRFGRHKWLWGGGKSLEGSIAFAAAVSCGLIFARICLSLGRWPISGSDGRMDISWPWAIVRAILAAGGASTTEAILTGCNDNVVVPVVLWLLVRGFSI